VVGTVCGIIGHLLPGINIDDLSFDGELFLSVLLPPIIFEAALSVSKKDFRRRRLAIFMFAVVGTILSTFMTGVMVHYASLWLKNSTTIPMLDCIIYGALISSIDPVAILSVLTSLNMSQTDTVFILVFGESLLNDGVAITITENLSGRFGEGSMSVDEVLGVIADFAIVGFGSIFVGFICACLCMTYFWIFGKMLNPGMEVASFFLWALIPYWICDDLEWSGIVSIVTMGFFMDVYVASPLEEVQSPSTARMQSNLDMYMKMEDDDVPDDKSHMSYYSNGKRLIGRSRFGQQLNVLRLLIHKDRIRLSEEADKHVRFVAHLLAQLAENAIFAYLGLFLLSRNYDWDFPLVTTAVVICIVSRALMVIIICWTVWYINIFRRGVKGCGYENDTDVSRTANQLQNNSTRLVLIFAGLRGAVSLALVENIPLYNNVTKEGCEFKPVLKAMTSASIIFTMFVFGGGAYYIFPMLGIKPDNPKETQDSCSLSNANSTSEMYEIQVPNTNATKQSNRPSRDGDMYEMGQITSGSGTASDRDDMSSTHGIMT
jgi:NhaP-type Na+/H+ or K+/H+ antiporter